MSLKARKTWWTMKEAIVFDIQRLSLHDGPGVRTTIFLKGCNLHCAWCHNPESQQREEEIVWERTRCIDCRRCAHVCEARGEEPWQLDKEVCTGCGCCVKICPGDAIRLVGERWPVKNLAWQVLRDQALFEISGGGVTISGGEPLLQSEAVAGLIHILKEQGVHTALDTAGNVPWEDFEAVLGDVDLFLYDIKTMDSTLHRRFTGVDNAKILDNLCRLVNCCPVIIRIPMVREVNLGEARAIARYLKELGANTPVELLPYHSLGAEKYLRLNRSVPAFTPPTQEELESAAEEFRRLGLTAEYTSLQ